MRIITPCFALFIAVLAISGPVLSQNGQAQPASPASEAPQRFVVNKVRAVDAATLISGQTPIKLWAVETVESQSAAFNLRGRTELDNAIGQAKIMCEIKKRDAVTISAQCTNAQDQDLSLYMLQQGFVTVERSAVYGTVFEDAYIQAEMQAQSRGIGVWGDEKGGPAKADDGVYMVSFGFILFICIIAAFIVLSIIIMRGFQKVIEAQNQNVEMMSKERKLRDKERGIVAVMLDSELKANKAKIEAYRVVYEEMLKSLKDPDRPPKYKKAGDIIQKQPALARQVFDRNTDKLDMLGARLSSEVIHFYARIKSTPDYINLEPSTPLEEAVAMLEKSLEGARRLDDLAGRLLESFTSGGIISEDFQE
jgi:endonuclease YncB( thermonuclease family)